jgi:hypothetical protein
MREFIISNPGKVKLSEPPCDSYTLESMERTRSRLNVAKSKMDSIFSNPRWVRLQRSFDSTARAKRIIQTSFGGQNVSNAWLKYWELYAHYIGDSAKPTTKVFFNAELPGASLSAWNHYCQARGFAPNWVASSLWPGETDAENTTGILDDVYGFYQMNPGKWLMNKQSTGNMTLRKDIMSLKDVKVDFYSHDAGISVITNAAGENSYNNQEEMNLAIHLGCAIAGLMTLKPGGTFIAKQYTFFQTLSWQLMIYYASLFDEFRICKPITSRPYNSEIYLVGTGFRGLPGGDLDHLLDLLDRTNVPAGQAINGQDWSSFPILFCDDEVKSKYIVQLAEIMEASDQLFNEQTAAINRNISDFYKTRQYEALQAYERSAYDTNKIILDEWFAAYPVPSISREQWLPGIEKQNPRVGGSDDYAVEYDDESYTLE